MRHAHYYTENCLCKCLTYAKEVKSPVIFFVLGRLFFFQNSQADAKVNEPFIFPAPHTISLDPALI